MNIAYAFVTGPTSVLSPNQCISTKTTETKIITASLQWQSTYPQWQSYIVGENIQGFFVTNNNSNFSKRKGWNR